MHLPFRLLLLIGALVTVHPASAQCQDLIASTERSAAPSKAAHSVISSTSNDYILGSGDQIRVVVYGELDVSGDHLIDPSGHIAIPLIGDVTATGITTDAVAHSISQRLSAGAFVQNARVTVSILTYRPFFILGEVQKPGAYPYMPDMTALAAVATAGGYTYRANTKRMFVQPAGEVTERPTPPEEVKLHPGDTLRIAERFF